MRIAGCQSKVEVVDPSDSFRGVYLRVQRLGVVLDLNQEMCADLGVRQVALCGRDFGVDHCSSLCVHILALNQTVLGARSREVLWR